MGRMHKIAIAIDERTLRRVDDLVRNGKKSRSEFIRAAVERAVREELEREIGEKIDEVFGREGVVAESRRMADEMLASSPLAREAEEW